MEITDKNEVRKLMRSQKPVAIFFYWEECGHCENMMKPWDELSKKYKGKVAGYKVESANIPEELDINGFPRFYSVKNGIPSEPIVGEQESAVLEKQLFGGRRGGSRTRRNRSRRLTRRRR
jgi:thioredoxin-like negative regulator of GroEL